jgi:UPF0042 nucleotide-binding protein
VTGASRTDASEVLRPRLVLVTGLSGSGKSSVGNALEDLGYYTVDNLPLPLLRTFLKQPGELVPQHRHIAVVTDVRAPGFHEELPTLVRGLDRQRLDVTLLFLEASDETLVRRFSETRRPHPLAVHRPVIEGIRRERELLADLRGLADRVLDTGEWTIHDVRNQIYRAFAMDQAVEGGEGEPGMVVSLTSFGFKHGIPYGTDMLFDVRFLPNPYFVPELKDHSGRDAEVRDFLDRQPEFHDVVERFRDLLSDLLPRFESQNRSYLAVAVGCTGGRHRSVAGCEALRDRLAENGWGIQVIHRDLDR